jgi:hypothetical protein
MFIIYVSTFFVLFSYYFEESIFLLFHFVSVLFLISCCSFLTLSLIPPPVVAIANVRIHGIYVCMYVCMYVCICIYVCMFVLCMCVCCICTYVCVCMYICMQVRTYVCMYVCMLFMYVNCRLNDE